MCLALCSNMTMHVLSPQKKFCSPSSLLQCLATTNLLLSPWIWLFWTIPSHINRIMQHDLLWSYVLLLCLASFTWHDVFSHGRAHISNSFPFIASNIPLYRYTNLGLSEEAESPVQWVQKKWCPLFGYYEWCCCKNLGSSLCVDLCFHLFQVPRCGIATSYGNSMFNLLRNCFPKMNCSQQSARLFFSNSSHLSPPAGYQFHILKTWHYTLGWAWSVLWS